MDTVFRKSELGQLRSSFVGNCSQCCGLCCTALCFAVPEGFPEDKPAGRPCSRLTAKFGCSIHGSLLERGLKGCVSYDCFGAGQRTVQCAFEGRNWMEAGVHQEEYFAVFLDLHGLCQTMWYLTEAAFLLPAGKDLERVFMLLLRGESASRMPAAQLRTFDFFNHRESAGPLLRRAARQAAAAIAGKQRKAEEELTGKSLKSRDFSGVDFAMKSLTGSDLRGCSFRGANFLGADLRDANLCGADLKDSVFLTGGQLSAAIGDETTLLPSWIPKPDTWSQRHASQHGL